MLISRIQYKLLINLVIIAFFVPFGNTVIHGATMSKGPYLIYQGTTTEMEVLWQLDATQSCTLEWGLDTNYSDGSVLSSEINVDHRHRYAITGLSEGTMYYYRVTEGSNSYPGSFTTAPSDSATAIKFLAFGDTRSNPSAMNGVTGQMMTTLTADPAFQTFCLHSGDWNGTDSGWGSEFFNTSYLNTLDFLAMVPVLGCRGNHEGGGSNYRKYYPYPYVGNHYFSFDYGPVHVAIVDNYTTYTPGSAQYNWLENDLATSSKLCKVVMYHAPAWSAGYHGNNTTAQTYLQPLFETYNVSLVFNGHNHYYSRAYVNGVQHITAGGGGAPLYSGNANDPYIVAYNRSYHHCEIDVDGGLLSYTAVKSDGSVIDSFTMGIDPTPPSVEAGINMITWSGRGVQLAPDVVNTSDPVTALTYAWSADPDTGVVFDPVTADTEAPLITITKATSNPDTVTLTLAVNNVDKPPVEDTMTIDVYDDECKAAIGKWAADYPSDFYGNCITDLEDLAFMLTKWLTDNSLTAPVAK